MKNHRAGAALIAAWLFGAGCVSVNAYQTATTVGEDKVRVIAAPSGLLVSTTTNPLSSGSTAVSNLEPRLDVGVEYGVARSVDVGMRLGMGVFSGGSGASATSQVLVELGLASKFQLVGVDKPKGLKLALAPSLHFAPLGVLTAHADLPVLIGIAAGGHQIVLGPRVQPALAVLPETPVSGGQAVFALSTGGTIGVALRILPALRLMPEIGLSFPIIAQPLSGFGANPTSIAGSTAMVQFGLGVLWDPPMDEEEPAISPAISPPAAAVAAPLPAPSAASVDAGTEIDQL